MSPAVRPWLRHALAALAAAVSILLLTTLMPSPAHAAAKASPGTPAFSVKVLANAAKHKGKPYRWGATGPRAFDCSGYTRWVMRKAVGKKLPRTSRAQARWTKRVSKRHVRPGDLVFMARHGRVYHVAIYAGRGKVWNAPHTGARVRKERIWTRGWFGGRVR
jgi:cell wall-associated NlpC family hydrolase